MTCTLAEAALNSLPLRSGLVATEHLADARRNVMRVCLQREVAAIQHLDHRLWIIPLPGHCARWNKERIVLAPDHQRWHLLLAKERLDSGTLCEIPLVPEIKRDLNIIRHKSKFLSPAVEEFCALWKTNNTPKKYIK